MQKLGGRVACFSLVPATRPSSLATLTKTADVYTLSSHSGTTEIINLRSPHLRFPASRSCIGTYRLLCGTRAEILPPHTSHESPITSHRFCPLCLFNHLRIAPVLPPFTNLFLFNQLRIAQFASPLFVNDPTVPGVGGGLAPAPFKKSFTSSHFRSRVIHLSAPHRPQPRAGTLRLFLRFQPSTVGCRPPRQLLQNQN